MNINDDVIREWFYRLPKGYAEAPYSESELFVLADVIAEHDSNVGKSIPEAVELVTEEDSAEVLIIKSIGLSQDVNMQIIDVYNGLSDKEKEEFDKNLRTHTIESFVSSGWKVFEKFFPVVARGTRAGMGRGEVMILLGVEDSEPGGTSQHDIVMPDSGGAWEVKELSKGVFDPANEGAATRFDLTSKIQKFYNEIIDPLAEIGDPYESLKNMVDVDSLDRLKDLIRIFETRFQDSIDPEKLQKTIEWKKSAFYNWYEGFKELHDIFYNTNLDVDIKDTRLSVNSDGKQQSYWIADKDAEEINISSSNDSTATITIGDPVDNINTNIKIWFNRIMRNEFIKNPKQFISELNTIKTTFFDGILGLIWFNSKDPKPHLGPPEMFSIVQLTNGKYRFVLKNISSSNGYPHIQEQE